LRDGTGTQNKNGTGQVFYIPGSTPKYLVCIVSSSEFVTGIVLVFDQLNDPQFLHRLILPLEKCEILNPRLFSTKGVEQTALVIKQNFGLYISDLVNDFKEIDECNIHEYNECIGAHGEMRVVATAARQSFLYRGLNKFF